jgi:hypothetical protein
MSISAACGGWNETVAAYRLLNCEDVCADALISPHREATIQRCAMFPCVVVSQDTTEFDDSHMKGAEGFGPLNDENRRGFLVLRRHCMTIFFQNGGDIPLHG